MPPAPKVLAADDEEGWRDLLAHWLKEAGFEVRVAADGKSVLPLAEAFQPDCFILDHDLGDTTGYNLCSKLKADARFKAKPVVLLTANVDVLPKVAAGFAADHFVAKSENPDELMLILGGLLEKR